MFQRPFEASQSLARGQRNCYNLIWEVLSKQHQKGIKTQQDYKSLWNNSYSLSQLTIKDFKGKYKADHLKGKELKICYQR